MGLEDVRHLFRAYVSFLEHRTLPQKNQLNIDWHPFSQQTFLHFRAQKQGKSYIFHETNCAAGLQYANGTSSNLRPSNNGRSTKDLRSTRNAHVTQGILEVKKTMVAPRLPKVEIHTLNEA